MREWNLKSGDPLSLTIAADARLCQPDYADDQIWELSLDSADTGAVVLGTTYGLRARNMRMFARFVEGDTSISASDDFDVPPAVRQFYPNYLRLTYAPLVGVEVTGEYWVPESHVVAGRLRLFNSGVTPRRFRLEWVALMTPGSEGRPMAPAKMDIANVLVGQTDDIAPVVFMTGGPEGTSSPYPSLDLDIELLPGQERRITWVHAALEDAEASFDLARKTAARNWEAEVARLEMTNASQVEIYTGDPDWDAAFALGQKAALNLLHGPTPDLPNTSFTITRQPDQGYSNRGDGSDYNHLWNGQPPLEAWYLTSLLSPGSVDIAKGLLLNYLKEQKEDGFIDWKPGLAGQRSRMLATPLLASLAWQIYQTSEDRRFLEQVFQPLLDFLHAWFTGEQDRDGDGIPEWDHPMQTGYDDNPAFARWHGWAQGADITLFESPALCAFLYRECQTLIEMAQLLKRTQPIPAIQALADNMHTAIEASWNARAATYEYWDRETHRAQAGEELGKRTGPGEIYLDLVFELPVRLMLRVETGGDTTIGARAFLHGTTASGQHVIERLERGNFQWFLGLGTATVERLYADLERVQVEGIGPDDEVSLHIVDYRTRDHTLFLPIWAKAANPKQVKKIVKRNLFKPTRYGREYGIPACPKPPRKSGADICSGIWLPWNALIAEGLLAYDMRAEAAELVTRIMKAIVQSLKQEGAFFKHYDADTGQTMGERNALTGLPPLGLFLQTLGVRIHSPWRISLEGSNPYPRSVKIQYRGLTIERGIEETIVTFPNGQSVSVEDSHPCIIDGQQQAP